MPTPASTPPPLHSTHKIDGTGPRRTQSYYQAVATARGYTIKAGAATRARLYRGVPTCTSDLTTAITDGTLTKDQHKENNA